MGGALVLMVGASATKILLSFDGGRAMTSFDWVPVYHQDYTLV